MPVQRATKVRSDRGRLLVVTAAVLVFAVAFNVAEHLFGLPLWLGPVSAWGWSSWPASRACPGTSWA